MLKRLMVLVLGCVMCWASIGCGGKTTVPETTPPPPTGEKPATQAEKPPELPE